MAQRRARAPWYVGSREQLPGLDVWSYSVIGNGAYFITQLPWARNRVSMATFHNGASVLVDWGDGTTTLVNADTPYADMQHQYDVEGDATFVVTLSSTQWSDIEIHGVTYVESDWYFCYTLYELLTPIPTLHEDSDFYRLFQYAENLKEIPGDLLSKNPNIKVMDGLFLWDSQITEIPADLFANNTGLVNLSHAFQNTGIAEIPAGLFDNCPLLEDLSYCFYDILAGLKVPVDLFAKNTKVTDFSYVFPTLVANAECEDGTPYCTLEIGSEVVTNVDYFYTSLSGIDTVYVTVAEGSTTASTIQAWNESTPSRMLIMNTTPCTSQTTWKFDTVENCTTAGVPISTTTAYNGMTIDWGDGTVTTVSSTADYVHTYETAGQYHITVTYDDWANVTLACSAASSAASPIAEARTSITRVYKLPTVAQTDFSYLFYNYTLLIEVEAGLFDNNPQATSFGSAFSNCVVLTALPKSLFDNNTLVTDFSSTFSSCETLITVPEDLFDTNLQTTTFASTFSGCLRITSLPERLFANNTLVTDFSSTFYGCTALTSLPEGLFASNTQALTFTSTFSGCTALTSLPEGLFDSNTLATDFNRTFYSCDALTSLPEGLFDSNTQVLTFTATFGYCTSLTSLPDGLFDNNIVVTSFSSTFYRCTALRSIPDGLFDNNTQVTSFYRTFYYCSALRSIPEGLFDNNTLVTTFDATFYRCNSSYLTVIPDGLFDNNTLVTDFSETFSMCTYVAAIPDGLFDNNTLVTTFESTFSNCSRVTSIPDGLFDNNTLVTTFNSTFSNCSRVTSIPDGLFDNNTLVTTFNSTFFGCIALISIPDGLFDNNTQVTSFYRTFYNCSSITEIPSGLFDNNSFATTFQQTFASCSSLTTIPENLFVNNTRVTGFRGTLSKTAIAPNKQCLDGTQYFSLNITSEYVTSFVYTTNSDYFWTPSTASVDAVYITVPEGSTTETTALAYNESYPNYALTLNTDPCPVTWEFDTVEVCLEVGVPISTSVAYTGMTIDWGDGNVTTVASIDDYVHTYDTAGQYHITVTYDDWANVELSCTEESVSPIAAARGGIAKVYKLPQVANTSFAYLFYEYNQLTAIEDGLFDNNTQITNFAYTFYNCYQMTTIPEQLFASHTLVTDFTQTFRDSGRIDNQTLYIGSEVVTSADMFMYETASYGNLNTVYVPANSTTETTFNSAMNIGCTVATYTP